MEKRTRILVVYATKYGATAGIASAIADAARESGVEADVQLAREAGDLSSYTGVVVGSPVYAGSWMADALDFVKKHRDFLKDMPVAYFTVGMLLRMKPEEGRQEHNAAIEKVRQAVPEARPVEVGMFVGALDKSKMGFFPRLMMTLMRAEEGDFRDWAAVREWSAAVSARLSSPE